LIAVDTSSLIAYLAGENGPDVAATELALAHRQAALPPVVLSELLSASNLDRDLTELFTALPLLHVTDGYWERVGLLRAGLLARRHRAGLADTLITQSCLDHDVELITRDADFRVFARVGLRVFGYRARG
jgi:predicted nucleic acid-binding protein